MIALIALSLLIGVAIGMLGGGGSVLAVPILTYVAGMPPKEAIATSLLVVGTTALFALFQHAKRGTVQWRTGALFAGAAMVGAYGGGSMAHWFSGTTLLVMFAAMMLVTGLAMFRGRKNTQSQVSRSRPLPIGLIIGEGILVGAATGLVGAGGGFLVVPALVLLGGMTMQHAVATSLFVIVLKSFAAFAGHAAHVNVDLQTIGIVSTAAVVGSIAGAFLSHRLPELILRRVFAIFVLCMAVYILVREIL